MRAFTLALAALSLGPLAGAQEIVDQQIQADAFVYTGAKARETAPPPKPEMVDQTIEAEAFVYTGAKARAVAPLPAPEIADQTIRADAFTYTGAKAREN